ncbi:MAG: DinB family protein, partial [Thermoanaerobaculia bacterium]
MLDHLRRLFEYDDWANRETLRSLAAVSSAPPILVGRMAHILGAEWLWLARLRGEPKPMAVWPE